MPKPKYKEARKKAAKTGKPVVLRDIDRQVGDSSTGYDLPRPALPPGKRMSKTGNVYWETRRNRSDRKGRRI